MEPHSPKFLIVDDDPVIRRGLIRILKLEFPKLEIQEAEYGFEAGQKSNLFLPDLIILDIQIPGFDGVSICEIIRKNPKLKESKILAISGVSDWKTQQDILEAGANVFLRKPLQKDTFVNAVKSLINQKNSTSDIQQNAS